MNEHRSGCPINLTLETLGDRWSLIVIRDLMFGNRRHFRRLLTQSEEGIASNILAARLKRLEAAGLVSRRDDPSHKQKAIYSLTEAGIELVPLLAQMGAWADATRPLPESFPCGRRSSKRAALRSGPSSWRNCATCIWARRVLRRRSSPGCRPPTRPKSPRLRQRSIMWIGDRGAPSG